jgi:hypothetical protein
VLGVMLGYSRIPDEFKSGIGRLADVKFEYTDYSFNSICDSTLKRALAAIHKNGGKVTDTEVVIPCQTPKPPKLEQWNPGVPARRVDASDPAWTWSPGWAVDKETRVSREAGSETILRFNGVAVAVMGRLDQEGGRATVYLDGKKAGSLLDAYIVKNTHDDTLWHTYGLKPGDHTLKIVTLGAADPRSTGQVVAIDRAVIYRQP